MNAISTSFRFIKFYLLLIFLITIRILLSQKGFENGDLLKIRGRVYSEPNYYETAQIINLRGVRIKLPRYPEISLGDKIIIQGMVEDNYIKDAKLISHSKSELFIYSFRQKLLEVYQSSLPGPHWGLVAGVVLGSKAGISQQFYESLKASGTLHVVVASGMNVTLVAGFLLQTLVLFMNRRRAVIIAIMGIWVYVAIAGFDAPLVRAAIMGSIAFSALKLGRAYLAWRGLFISAFVMLFLNPNYVSNLGFILSFTATASLMLFERFFSRLIHFVPGFFREGLSTSLAAQIGVAPILYWNFGEFNLFSPFINAAVVWTIPYVTIIGVIGGVLGLAVPFFGKAILFVVYPLTEYFIFVISNF